MLRDHHDVVLGFREGRHATVVLHVTRTRVIGRKRVDDVAIKHVQHLREVSRAVGDLQVGVIVIGRIDPEIACGSRHDLGETERSHGGARPDLEAAFLPDQGLQEAAPLNEREPCAADAGQVIGVAGRADGQLLDPFPGIAEHPGCSRVVVLRRIETGRRNFDVMRARSSASEAVRAIWSRSWGMMAWAYRFI